MRVRNLSIGAAAVMSLAAMSVAAAPMGAAPQGHGNPHTTTRPASAGPKTTSGPKTTGAPKTTAATTPKTHGNPHTATGTTATTTSPKGHGKTTTTTATTSTSSTTTAANTTSTDGTTTTLNPIAQKISSKPNLSSKIQSMLPSGMTLDQASLGFKNQGQFIAAVHVSENLGIPFADLKTAMTGIDPTKPAGTTATGTTLSLGQAIQKLRPSADATSAESTAQRQATSDLSGK